MNCIVDKRELSKAINLCSGVINTRTTLPILSNILVEADEGLTLTATDLETFIMCTVPSKVQSKGEFTVPASLFKEWIASAPDESVVLHYDENKLECKSGDADITLLTLPVEQYVCRPVLIENKVAVDGNLLREALKKILPATCTDATRAILSGVHLIGSHIVATDTHRLHFVDVNKPLFIGEGVIIQLQSLKSVVNSTCDTISVGYEGGLIEFECDNVRIHSRLIDGQFPNYEKVIPKNCEVKVTVPKRELYDCLRRIGIVAEENAHKVLIDWSTGELKAESAEVGRGQEQVRMTCEGEGFPQAVNGQYLMDALAACDSDEVTIELTSALNPLKVVDGDFLAVVMPMQF